MTQVTIPEALSVPELFSLHDKIALVTGATGLIGRHYCTALAEAGATVIIADLQQARCEQLLSQLPNSGHLAIQMDVTSPSALTMVRDTILEQFGRLDVLVNNAAINDMFENPALAAEQSRFENYPLDMWLKSMDVNLTGVFLSCQILGTIMAERGSGSIINIASTYGIIGPDQQLYQKADGEQVFYKSPAYPSTKGALLNFTRYLAAYWGPRGLRVNTLSPGGVENGQEPWFTENYARRTPLGRMARAWDYKGALIFLASDASAYMTGANLVVDGGWTAI